jgi:hypothetical protein
MPVRRALALLALAGAVAAGLAAFHRAPAELHAKLSPVKLWADGYDAAALTVTSTARPTLSIEGNLHVAVGSEFEHHDGVWAANIRAGVLPGTVRLRVSAPGARPLRLTLATAMTARDSSEDGTPDFLRLDSTSSRAAFQRWFTFLAEAQYFQPPESRPSEIDDCAALIRYAYRESLRAHDSTWSATARLPLIPAFDSPGKYEYPYTALGSNIFRVTPGPFREADAADGAFAQFADAKTLLRYNTYLVSRDLSRAQPGDILFYHQLHDAGPDTYHSMIFLGKSQIHPDNLTYILYHTGPQQSGPGEVRRLSLDELRNFPDPVWRPGPENPRFLGVYRWNILHNAVSAS